MLVVMTLLFDIPPVHLRFGIWIICFLNLGDERASAVCALNRLLVLRLRN